MMETSEIAFGHMRLAYTIRRSQRRQKTVAVSVDPRLGVVLTAPSHLSTTRLDALVRQKARWIVTRLGRLQEGDGPLPPREFVSGESYWYLGRHYRLKVVTGTNSGDPKLHCGWIRVPVSHDPHERAARVRTSLVSWYRQHAAQHLPERVAQWCPLVGVPLPHLIIADQKRRWGSCNSRGSVRFNWRIVQAPMRLVDYVAAHELVHLLHRGHGREFWRTLGKAMPDYERRRQELRRLGPTLQW